MEQDHELKQKGKEAASAARELARSKAESGKHAASEKVEETSRALEDAAEGFSAQGQETLAEAATVMARRMSEMASALENRNVEDLLQVARRQARENPALFVAGGLAVGLVLSRFFKASAEREHEDSPPDFERATMSPGTEHFETPAISSRRPPSQTYANTTYTGGGTTQ